MNEVVKIVVVGDCSIAPEVLAAAAEQLDIPGKKIIKKLYWGGYTRAEMQKQLLHVELEGPTAEPCAEGLEQEIVDADYLLSHLGTIPAHIIKKAPRLKLMGCCRGGMEMVDVAAATECGIPVINVIRNAEATSDFAVGLMFAETRNIARSHAAIKQGNWRKDFVNVGYTKAMRDMRVGIVGLGHIGKLVAQKMKGMGIQVLGHDPYVSPESMLAADLADIPLLSIEELFAQSDIVSLHMRATPETEGMIGERLLGMMQKTAYIVNTSRAKVLDKDALVQALKTKSIGGAALDVFWDEPILPQDPLLELDNLTMTSHLGGNVVDALPKSPMLLAKTINGFMQSGFCDTLVNKQVLQNKK